MALVLADRVRDTTTTAGTGTVTLSGTAPTGYQNFSTIGNGNTTYYTINGGSQWEVGIGTYSSTGPTLSRDTVLASSTGSKVDFNAGTKDVFVTYPAEKSVNYDAFDKVGIGVSAPGYRLDVASSDTTANVGFAARLRSNTTATAAALQFTNTGATAQNGFLAATDTGFVTLQADGASSLIAFRTAGAERARIDNSGNLLLGTSTTKNRLTVTAGANTNSPTLGSAGGIAYFTNTDVAYGLNVGNSAADGRVWLQAQRTDGSATAYNITLNEAGGNVGIGTTSVTQKLTVQGAQLTIPAAGWSAGQVAYNYLGDTNNGISAANGGDTNVFGFNGITFSSTGYGGEKMRITYDGNVGIGQSNPTQKLWVGSSGSGGFGTATPDAISLGNTFANSAGDPAKLKLRLYQDSSPAYYGFGVSANLMETHVPSAGSMAWYTGGSERMRLTSTGVFGLGISGGDASLHVVGIRGGNGRMTQMSTGGTSQSNLNLIASSSAGGADQWFSYGVAAANYYYIQNGVGTGDSGLVINSNNRVMVGTSTAFDTTVGANFMASGSAGSAAAFRVNATTTTQVSFYDSSQTARVGWIGTGGSSTSYNTTSDRRLKKNIQPVADCGDKIDQIEIISHEWRNGTSTVIPYGVIAQDLYEIAPHAVTKGDEGEEVGLEWGVDYSKLVPMLVKEIQSLRARVTQLEGK